MSIASSTTLSQLRHAVSGRVLLPGDPEFAGAGRPWNLAVDQSVAAVVEAADAADVAALVRFAARNGRTVAAQPNGHGASGNADGTILLRTGRLDRIEIDPVAKRATIGAGVRSGDLQRAAAAHGLTGLPGSSPVVSVTGVALGGGLSWFGRAFGWVSDAVSAFDIVDARGVPRRITADSDPDLFWALRGGGGDYAIVTALEMELREAPEVFGGRVLWHASHARAVVAAFRAMTAAAPDSLSAWLEFMQFPGAEPMIAIDATHLGPESEARALQTVIDRLPAPLSDTRAAMTAADLGSITGDPTDPGPGLSRTELLTDLDDAAIEALTVEPVSPLMIVQIRHLGGALAAPSDSPHGPLAEPYAAYMFGVPTDPASAGAIEAKQRALAAALPVSGRKPVTFLNPTERLSDALPAASIERLRLVKTAHDPDGVLRANFSPLA
ncbi:FAD-binding oxidoreductase [Glycomyces albus]